MKVKEFLEACTQATEPEGVGKPLLSLWYDKRGDWDRAHQIAQEIPTPLGSAVHAYLHREEGDAGNAAYWYSRAGRPVYRGDLDAEWTALVHESAEPD